MQPSAAKFSGHAIKTSWWLGTASLAFGVLVKITSELLEHEVSGVNRAILIGFAKARTPWLTAMAVDLTALGSVTLAVLVSSIALCVLLLLKDRMGALQLVAASVGAGILTATIKNYIDRPRDHTAGGNISHLPRSALPKRRREWHIAWGLGAFAGRVLFVFPRSQGHRPRAIVLWIERLPVRSDS